MQYCILQTCVILSLGREEVVKTIILLHLSAQGYSGLFQWKLNISTISFLSLILFLPSQDQPFTEKVGTQMYCCGSLGIQGIPYQHKHLLAFLTYFFCILLLAEVIHKLPLGIFCSQIIILVSSFHENFHKTWANNLLIFICDFSQTLKYLR